MGNTTNTEKIICKKCQKIFTNNTNNKNDVFYQYCQQCTIFCVLNKDNTTNTNYPIDTNNTINTNYSINTNLPSDLS